MRYRGSALLALTLVLASCASALTVGTASVDITPSWPVPLGGYGARKGKLCDGVHDPVFARALWLDDGETHVAILATDLIGSSRTLRDDIERRLGGGVRVILTATHNHSGPGGLVKYPDEPMAKLFVYPAMGAFDPKLYDTYLSRFVDVILKARNGATPGEVGFASVDVPEFTRNRRKENYAKDAAPVDPALGVLFVDGRPAMINYTAHGTVLGSKNMLISGDWPAPLATKLDVLVTNGAEGDIAPNAPDGDDGFQRCVKMAEGLAAKMPAKPARGPAVVKLRYVEKEVDLPKATVSFMPTKSVLGVLVIGDAALICVPGEICVELGLELKRAYREKFGFKMVWIVGLANDHLGYFLTEAQFKKGGYEATISFYGSTMGPWLVERFLEIGKSLAE